MRTTFNIFLAVLLILLGWAANELGMFFNALFVLLLLAAPVQILRALWRLFRGTSEFGLWRNLKNFRWHWGQIANKEIFWVLAGVVLEICVVPTQFPPQEYLIIRFMIWGAIATLILLELVPGKRLFLATNLAFLAGSIFMTYQIGRVYWPISETQGVVLTAPFRGECLVVQGGQSTLINHHYGVVGQRHALDMIRLVEGRGVMRNKKEATSSPSWGETLYAPADGKIVSVANDLDDNPIGRTDSKNLAGNHLVVDIGHGRFVLMAHLQKGSVSVAPGDSVHAGEPVARCGNSGNTTQPHLHIQVQNQPDFLADGVETYPILFRDVVLVRRHCAPSNIPTFLRRNDRIFKD